MANADLRIHQFIIDGGHQVVGGKSHWPDMVSLVVPKDRALEIAMNILGALRYIREGEEMLTTLTLSGKLEQLDENGMPLDAGGGQDAANGRYGTTAAMTAQSTGPGGHAFGDLLANALAASNAAAQALANGEVPEASAALGRANAALQGALQDIRKIEKN